MAPPALRPGLQQRDIPRVNAIGHHLVKGQNCTFPYLHIQMPASRYMQHLSTYISRYQGPRHCPLGLSEACHTESSARPSSRSLPEVKTAIIINHPYIHHLRFVDQFVGSCIRLGVPDEPRAIIELKELLHIFFTVRLIRSQEVMFFHPHPNCSGMSLKSLLPSSLFFAFLCLPELLLHFCLLHYLL